VSPKGAGHVAYGLRAANELAYAYLRRSRIVPSADKETNLRKAEEYLKGVKSQVDPQPPMGTSAAAKVGDKRTHCTVCVLESRLHRERNEYPRALAAAQSAKAICGTMKFSRIDACISIGEAAYALGDYHLAVAAFKEALDIGRHSLKVAAVCHLHLSRAY